MGHIASSAANAAPLSAIVDGVFSLSTHKAEEVQFAVGEALCFVFGGEELSCKLVASPSPAC